MSNKYPRCSFCCNQHADKFVELTFLLGDDKGVCSTCFLILQTQASDAGPENESKIEQKSCLACEKIFPLDECVGINSVWLCKKDLQTLIANVNTDHRSFKRVAKFTVNGTTYFRNEEVVCKVIGRPNLGQPPDSQNNIYDVVLLNDNTSATLITYQAVFSAGDVVTAKFVGVYGGRINLTFIRFGSGAQP